MCRRSQGLYRSYRGAAHAPSADASASGDHGSPDTLDRPVLWCDRGAFAPGDRVQKPLRSHIFVFGGTAVARKGSYGMDHRPHIVVVEDETTQRRLLVEYLARQNFRVSGAAGAPHAQAGGTRDADARAARCRIAGRRRIRASAVAAREESGTSASLWSRPPRTP